MRIEELLSLRPERRALPRGRSALPESEVEASRRGRILQAVIDEVAESGYAATTVAAITKRARVSRSSFYAAFTDKEDAFSTAYADATALISSRVWEPVATDPAANFGSSVRSVITTYVNALETSRAFTVCFYLELRAAGDRLLAQRADQLDENVDLIREVATSLAAFDDGFRVPEPAVLRALLGGFDELVAHEVRLQRGSEKLDLSSVIEPFWQLAMAVLYPT